MEPEFNLRRYSAALRRHRLFLIVPAIVVAVAGVGLAYLLPPVFQSGATILVESQQIPTDLATPTVTADAAERIHIIEQRLLTRDNLLEIANKYALYRYAGQDQSPTAIVDNMRKAISIDQIDTSGTGRDTTGVIGFTVKFQYGDPNTAAQVANDLVSSILTQNVESRLNRATETSTFFDQQKKDLEQQLLALENKIADYKQTNDAALPETLSDRRTQLIQVQLQIEDIQQKITAAADPAAASDAGSANVAQLTYALQAKQVDLDSLTAEHDKIAPLAGKGIVPTNRLSDLERDIAIDQLNIKSLQSQIAAAGGAPTSDDALKALKDRLADLQQQASTLSDGISRTPLVQVELNSMTRDYDNLQTQYQQAQAKLQDAMTGERLEQDRQAERFEVIEQATVPDKPSSPDRPKVMLGGLFGGLAAGAAVLGLRQSLDNAVYASADLERRLNLRAIATIPFIATKGERWRGRLRLAIILLGALAIAIALLVAIDRFYLPLDVVAQLMTQRAQAWLGQIGLLR